MAYTNKRYYYKVYNTTVIPNTLVTTWSEDVMSDPEFRTVINGGAGEMKIHLARRYDNFGELDDVTLGYKVQCFVSDVEAPNGLLIYTGYISAYSPVLDGDKEFIEVTLLGYVTETSYRILKDGSGNTTVTYSGTDPSLMMMDVITKYIADGGTHFSFNGSTIDLTGTSLVYTFKHNTIQEAFNKIIELCPQGWFWRMDPATNDVYLKQYNLAVPTHSVIIGKNITYLETHKRLEGVVNQVFVVGGGSPNLFNKYQRSASAGLYGLHESKVQDGNVLDNTTADAMAKRILDTYQLPETRSVIRIVDSNGENQGQGYDIESIKVGDTVQVKNLNFGASGVTLWDHAVWDVDVWDQSFAYTAAAIMLVVSVHYTPGEVEIEASSRLPEVSRRIEDVSKRVDQRVQTTLPSAPTTRVV